MQHYRLNGQANNAIPRAVFFQCTWLMKDYDRLRDLAMKAPEAESPEGAIVFYAIDSRRLTPESVITEARNRVKAVDRAMLELPEEYREAVFEYFAHEKRLPDEASKNTWFKWKQTFINALARELNLY